MPSEVRGIDAGTVAFRRLLADAGGRDQARVDTLVALGRRTVFVVTWPGRDAIRTLTNAGGETALPVFTGMDVMRIAAGRFGWLEPGGEVSHREIGAREALRHALEQDVGFVVVDLSAGHATEFTREEVASLIGQQRSVEGVGAYAAVGTASEMIRQAVSQSSRPAGGAESFQDSVPPPPRVPSDLAAAVGSSLDDRTAAHASAPAFPSAGGPLAERDPGTDASAPQMPHQLRRSVTGAPPPPDAEASREPSVTGARAPSVTGAAAPNATIMQASPMSAGVPNATLMQAPGQGAVQSRAPSVTGARAPSVTGARAPSVAGARAPSVAGARAPSVTGARAPSVTGAQPPPLVTPFGVAEERDGEREAPVRSKGPPPIPSPPPDAAADADVPSSAPPEAQIDSLESPAEPLDEDTLQLIAEALRRYPEVEWACELSDQDGEPVIGLRIDPSFSGRSAEIGDATQAAAQKDKVRVGVVLLVKPSQVRQARSLGRAFFPWRRRR